MTPTELRELLKLAAKAAGIEVWFPRMNGGKAPDGARIILTPCHTNNADGSIVEWAPQDDDAQAFRLAIRCRIDLDVQGEVAMAAMLGEDEGARVRLAIIRAAAEVGRGIDNVEVTG